MDIKKIKVGVIFGGRSSEYEVSIISAESVMNALDKNKFKVIPIGITKKGNWITGTNTVKILKSGFKHNLPSLEKIVIPDATKKSLVPLNSKVRLKQKITEEKLDVIFPILHGPYGEDGTIQGLLELANIPYVGAGVLGSAVGMDKVIQKQLFQAASLPIVKFISFLKEDWLKNKKSVINEILKKINFPCFVKPANLGSSVGISKIHTVKEIAKGIKEALKYDRKIIVEEGVKNPREIEVSVLGNDRPKASQPGEVIPSGKFYDYNAKYIDKASKLIAPAMLPKKIIKIIQDIALKAFKTINCTGMARVDFLVEKKSNKIYLSEINTIPGFTSISMYPKLWSVSGLSYPKLLEKLIQLAMERFKEKEKLLTFYRPRKAWYR